MKRDKWRFEVVEVLVICLVVAAVVSTWLQTTWRSRQLLLEAADLEEHYGASRNSEHLEEWIIRDFFHDRRGGVFVDVGANDYKQNSNTYYLETALEWSGLAIEPLKQFEADYHKFRPRSRFLPFFVSDVSNQEAKMYYLQSLPLVTSSNKDFTERWGRGISEITAPTITLNDLLAEEHVDHFDFMTMDIELSEPKALAGFDIERLRPELVCIEAQPEVRQRILEYFALHHYVILGKYLRADVWNLYFTPTS